MSEEQEGPRKPPVERPVIEVYEPAGESGPVLEGTAVVAQGLRPGLGARIRFWVTVVVGAVLGTVLFAVLVALAVVFLVPMLLAVAILRLGAPRNETPPR